ncbi:hypothetical protein BFAG_03792 [Bacteroides fragilis 3_1_12]|uniref:Uncharacterized protein n=1 Tax=Bacteroides fragilis 3_1_12 TaxID=457424 RepID=A0ABN0BQJ7_BACFG|nr:hypothetical protein BFAG_03792 [Bacteroides fragilis 3_1_12]
MFTKITHSDPESKFFTCFLGLLRTNPCTASGLSPHQAIDHALRAPKKASTRMAI